MHSIILIAVNLVVLKTEKAISLQLSPYAVPPINKLARRNLFSIQSTRLSGSKNKGLKALNIRSGVGLPRSRATSDLTLLRRVLLFLKRFLIEVFCVGIVLTLLRTTLQSKKSLLVCTFSSLPIRTNLLRWSFISLAFRLVVLHSEIIASTPSISRGENADWFLTGTYFILSVDNATPVPVKIRQVPGNGSCLFLAIAASLLYNESSINGIKNHPSMFEVQTLSAKLRNQAVNVLSSGIQQNNVLAMQLDESITASQLVKLAAQQHGITSNEYIKNMRNEQVWGGGPEIVALANDLKSNILLLEALDGGPIESSDPNAIYLGISAKFGPILKDEVKPPICILSANQNFPRLIGREAKCNHFLAVFPTASL